MAQKSKVVREPIGTWWRIGPYNVEINPFKVVAVTDHFVTFIEDQSYSQTPRLVERRTSRDDWFPSFAEAKEVAVNRANRAVDAAKNRLQLQRSALGQWESLKEPKEG